MRITLPLLLVAVLAGPVGSAQTADPKVHTVVMSKMTFGPVPASLRVGDVVLWVNKDIFRHTATAKDMSFDVDLEPGREARTVVKKAGAVSFYCRYHPGMKGTLRVTP